MNEQESPLSERRRVRSGLAAYVKAVRDDRKLRVGVAAAARRCGVSRDTLYEHEKADAEIGRLLQCIRDLKRSRSEERAARHEAREQDALDGERAIPPGKPVSHARESRHG